jgi:hypothetical protein
MGGGGCSGKWDQGRESRLDKDGTRVDLGMRGTLQEIPPNGANNIKRGIETENPVGGSAPVHDRVISYTSAHLVGLVSPLTRAAFGPPYR